MAKKSKIVRNNQREEVVARYAEKRAELKKTLVDPNATDEAREAAAALMPALAPLYERLDPESTGGAMLLGVDGVCIISHGSSSAKAFVNACRVAADLVRGDLVGHLAAAIRPDA